MLPLRLDMKTPATENALSLGTDVGEIFNKANSTSQSKKGLYFVRVIAEKLKY